MTPASKHSRKSENDRRCKNVTRSRSALLGIWVVTFAAALILFLPETVEACPTCKNDLHRSGMEVGFAISILFMIAVPFCIFAAWTIAILRLTRKTSPTPTLPAEEV